MKTTFLLIAAAVGLTLASSMQPSAQTPSSEEAVKTTHAALLAAIKTGNLTMAQAFIHPEALGYFRGSVNLVQLNAAYGPPQAVADVLADLGQFDLTPYQTVYRVKGNVAVVAMYSQLQEKDAKTKYLPLRSTYIYVSSDGNWKLLSWHTSATPDKTKSK